MSGETEKETAEAVSLVLDDGLLCEHSLEAQRFFLKFKSYKNVFTFDSNSVSFDKRTQQVLRLP